MCDLAHKTSLQVVKELLDFEVYYLWQFCEWI